MKYYVISGHYHGKIWIKKELLANFDSHYVFTNNVNEATKMSLSDASGLIRQFRKKGQDLNWSIDECMGV